MSKFNLKNYQKIDGDEHIETRLQEQHVDAPTSINQKQLDKYRTDESTSTTEKQLEKQRTGGAEETTEKQLNKVKASFDVKHRNAEAYEGDINKLEEKRLLNDPVEDEKYALASETPKKFKWWETDPQDGHKLAQKQKSVVTAALFDDEDDENKVIDPQEDVTDEFSTEKSLARWTEDTEGVETDPKSIDQLSPETGDLSSFSPLDITDAKELSGPISGVYMALSYDIDQYEDDSNKIKQDALATVRDAYPLLGALIDEDSFSTPSAGRIVLRVLGDEFTGTLAGKENEEDLGSDVSFEEIAYRSDDTQEEGSTTVMGQLKVDVPITDVNREPILEQAVEFIKSKHPALSIDVNSLDLSKENQGIVSYMVVAPNLTEASFEIHDLTVTADSKKK